MSAYPYLFSYSEESVYGRSASLLRSNVAADAEGIVLDLGCGGAAISAAVDEPGWTYVGVDASADAVAHVAQRGLEAHVVDLEAADVATTLDRIVAGRRVLAVLALDVLEHVARSAPFLDAIRGIVAPWTAPAILSVPNVAHIDVGAKLLLGRWDVTPTGLLDETHLQFFTEQRLEHVLAASGLHRIDRADFELVASDQAFPASHPVLNGSTNIGAALRALREQASPHASVNQFVWACLAGPAVAPSVERDGEERPFLTVVVRTQGRRIEELRETLLSLAAQSDDDFEVVVIGHRVDAVRRQRVEQLVLDAQAGLAERTTYVAAEVDGRAQLLNIGFETARGEYVAVLDDDDIVFADWVEGYHRLASKHAGKVLRQRSTSQQHRVLEVAGHRAIQASDTFTFEHDVAFSFTEHLLQNFTPFMTVAFPRGLWHDLGQRFDDTLTTVEDWDFIMRSVSFVDLAESAEITAVYRRWAFEDSSATEHDATEWRQNESHVHRKLDRTPMLFPAGSATAVRQLLIDRHQARAEAAHAWQVASERIVDHSAERRLGLIAEALILLRSRSWRLSAPLRLPGRLLGRRPLRADDLMWMDEGALHGALQAVRTSRSWRWTAGLRR